jgi:hypothetical protein
MHKPHISRKMVRQMNGVLRLWNTGEEIQLRFSNTVFGVAFCLSVCLSTCLPACLSAMPCLTQVPFLVGATDLQEKKEKKRKGKIKRE